MTRNNYVLIVLDSCRYDSFLAANPRTMRKLGKLERRWSYASWTAPSHFNLLMGLMPHSSPRGVFASEYYRRDFLKFNERIGAEGVEFKTFVPRLSLPITLQNLGYKTHAMVSLPVLNPLTILNSGFDTYKLMERHNDMSAMIDKMTFSEEQPSFYLLNVGETHYPYALPSESPDDWPRVSGVHGVFKHLDDYIVGGKIRGGKIRGGKIREGKIAGEKVKAGKSRRKQSEMFDSAKLKELRQRQINAVKYLDGVVEQLFDVLPNNTYVTITSDHGELFGEGGYFGHGPIHHPKVLEVPFVEGKLR